MAAIVRGDVAEASRRAGDHPIFGSFLLATLISVAVTTPLTVAAVGLNNRTVVVVAASWWVWFIGAYWARPRPQLEASPPETSTDPPS